ncbi:MAG: Fe-S cluster assembly protein SufD, partial [Abditibacteriales bacterium]|nr:Fe-S cluster assembly protein SufD [Abditibacteriales bacterium]
MVTTMKPETQIYLAHFEALKKRLDANGLLPLSALRHRAMERFAALGFPTLKHEEWKYTNVAPIARVAFQPTERGGSAVQERDLKPLGDVMRCRLVFVNGHFAPHLSTLDALPSGVRAGSLADALRSDSATVEAHLAQYAAFDHHPFVALNTALMEEGAFVHVRRGAVVEEPIHLLLVSTPNGAPWVAHPRHLIVLDENSQATVVETYIGSGWTATEGCPYFTNAVTEIVVGENAVLDHIKVQRESAAAFHIATVQLQLSRSSTVTSFSISLGGALVRNDINAVLGGEGAEATLNGLYVASGTQHVDHHTLIVHAQPHCPSHELYKGILDGKATAVFNGKIHVRPGAQKTDAKQTNQNLLLSRDATINTKPQLEIYADDVRCTHGATVGQLDADAL